MKKSSAKWMLALGTMIATVTTTVKAYASSGVTNPLSGQQGSVASILNTLISWVLGAVSAVAGAWMLFHLYKAVMSFMASANHAQKREEARAHLVHVIVAGVLLGAAGVIAGALYNFGAGLH